jgi:hypothetical protein
MTSESTIWGHKSIIAFEVSMQKADVMETCGRISVLNIRNELFA